MKSVTQKRIQNIMTPLDIPEQYMKAWADFRDRVDHREHSEAEVYSFEQSWASTACGHGGIGGSAITSAQTFVFNVQTGGWYVYQGGRFSYHVDQPNDQFYDDLKDWNLVGEVDYEGQYER